MKKHLYDTFADKWDQGGAIYFYSDPHFGDKDMLKIRSVSDDEQVKRINFRVGKKDTIIFLGDIGDISYISKIRGYKVLIMGNHDTGETNYRRETYTETLPIKTVSGVFKTVDVDNHLFDEVYSGILAISDKIILSHEPIDIPFMMNIHGHDHTSAKNDTRHFNCCAEAINYTPVSLNELVKSGLFSHIQSIHRQTIDKATERKQKRLNGGK